MPLSCTCQVMSWITPLEFSIMTPVAKLQTRPHARGLCSGLKVVLYAGSAWCESNAQILSRADTRPWHWYGTLRCMACAASIRVPSNPRCPGT